MSNSNEHFQFTDERFADLQMLRYRLNGFEDLTLSQQIYIYCLAKATLMGRDITFDQQGKYNLRIRKTLEAIYKHYDGDRTSDDFKALEVYLKRVCSPAASTTIMVVKNSNRVFPSISSMRQFL